MDSESKKQTIPHGWKRGELLTICLEKTISRKEPVISLAQAYRNNDICSIRFDDWESLSKFIMWWHK